MEKESRYKVKLYKLGIKMREVKSSGKVKGRLNYSGKQVLFREIYSLPHTKITDRHHLVFVTFSIHSHLQGVWRVMSPISYESPALPDWRWLKYVMSIQKVQLKKRKNMTKIHSSGVVLCDPSGSLFVVLGIVLQPFSNWCLLIYLLKTQTKHWMDS